MMLNLFFRFVDLYLKVGFCGEREGDRQVLRVFKNIFCFTIFLVFYCIPKIVCNKMDFLYLFFFLSHFHCK